MKRLRLEMIVPSLVPAGMELMVGRLARRLASRGHDVAVTCIEFLGSVGDQLRKEGLGVHVARSPGLRTIVYPQALIERLRQRRPDVVHVHSGAWLKGARAAFLADVSLVVHTEHGLLDKEPIYAPMLKRWASSYTGHIVAVSRPLLTYLQETDRLPAAKLHLIPNGVDTAFFSPQGSRGRLRSRFGLEAERIVIGHVGRFDPVKNHALLIEAFAKVNARFPETFLALIGDGMLRPVIERRVVELGIQHNVGLYGLADDLPTLYRDLDIFVLPSIAEGTSMSLLEAMACGVAPVATDVGGNADVIAQAGLIVPSADVASLATALERLAASTDERNRFARAARCRVIDRFNEDLMIERYEMLYAEAVHCERAATGNGTLCAG